MLREDEDILQRIEEEAGIQLHARGFEFGQAQAGFKLRFLACEPGGVALAFTQLAEVPEDVAGAEGGPVRNQVIEEFSYVKRPNLRERLELGSEEGLKRDGENQAQLDGKVGEWKAQAGKALARRSRLTSLFLSLGALGSPRLLAGESLSPRSARALGPQSAPRWM